nr:hypothetical protein CFP56_75509 [Quercus suber]
MPLHLLGKKSWHVYNPDNVSRVRQDEADAEARREAVEQRMQAEDAAYRTAVLRGEDPAKPIYPRLAGLKDEAEHLERNREGVSHKRPRRRLRGEDDTDRDIRFAREDAEAGEKARQTLSTDSVHERKNQSKEDPSIVDGKGHIRLFVEPIEGKTSRDNEKSRSSDERKRKREQDVSKMRLNDAAGYNDSMREEPWYASNKHAKPKGEAIDAKDLVLVDVQDKDVWGNEDPRRKSREQRRITSTDPFAAMQQAQSQLKQKERDRVVWEKQQAKELAELDRVDEDRRQRHKRHRRHRTDRDSLDRFAPDSPADGRSRDRERRRHRHRSRSREQR